jgi:hypothetical protein
LRFSDLPIDLQSCPPWLSALRYFARSNAG